MTTSFVPYFAALGFLVAALPVSIAQQPASSPTGAPAAGAARPPRDQEVEFRHWRQGEPPLRLIRQEEGFCALTRVSGQFEGAGEEVRVSLAADGYWYLGGSSAQQDVAADCMIVRFQTPSANPVAPAARPPVQMVRVLGAVYSRYAQFADVTARVKELVDGSGVFRVSPLALLVDPTPGQDKDLVVYCEVRGQPAIFTADAGDNVSREIILEKARIVLPQTASTIVAVAPVETSAPGPTVAPMPEASPAVADAPPLWLGDPGVDIDKARAASRAKFEAARHWADECELAAYDRSGAKGKNWDDDARQTIHVSCVPAYPTPDEQSIIYPAQKAACARALKSGCTDPLFLEIAYHLGIYLPGSEGDAWAKGYAGIERAMAKSAYPPYCKFLAAANAADNDVKGRHAPDGTIGRQAPGYALPASSWPGGTDVKTAFQHACAALEQLVQDPAAPPLLYMPAVEKLFQDAASDPIGRAEVLVPLAKFFEANDGNEHPAPGLKLVEGRFWIDYAWDARGGGFANTVTGEGWKLFGERIDKATDALQAAWKLDPGDWFAPTYMITVTGQAGDRDGMDTWFRRAMDADPNYVAAGNAKVMFLEPKWGGSWEDVMEFARQCCATQDWSTRMPMVLITALGDRAAAEEDPKAYWKQPEVWAQVEKVYSGLLKSDPKSGFDHTAYGIYAAFAEQWKVAHEQFEWVGDKPDENALRNHRLSGWDYQGLRFQAAEHTYVPPAAAATATPAVPAEPEGRPPPISTAANALQPFSEQNVDFRRWTQGDPPIRLMRKDEGFCALTRLTGRFHGDGENVRVYIGDDGYWYLNGRSGQADVGGGCLIFHYQVPVAAPPPDPVGMVRILAATFSAGPYNVDATERVRELVDADRQFQANLWWLRVDPNAHYVKTMTIFCEVRGQPAVLSVGEGESVSREILLARALPITIPPSSPIPAAAPVILPAAGGALAFGQQALEFRHWRQGDGAVKLIGKEEGFCPLTSITGHFAGAGEEVRTYVDPSGDWYLGGKSGQQDVAAECMVIRFEKPTADPGSPVPAAASGSSSER